MEEKQNKVLGIDPGYGRLGWAVVEEKNNKEILIDAGCLETTSKSSYNKRIQDVGNHITQLITTHEPNALALERVFFAKNQKTALQIAEVRGIIRFIAKSRPISEFTPIQIKQAICGYGNADKKQMQRMIMLLLRLAEPPKPDDTADAIAVAILGLRNRQNDLRAKTQQ